MACYELLVQGWGQGASERAWWAVVSPRDWWDTVVWRVNRVTQSKVQTGSASGCHSGGGAGGGRQWMSRPGDRLGRMGFRPVGRLAWRSRSLVPGLSGRQLTYEISCSDKGWDRNRKFYIKRCPISSLLPVSWSCWVNRCSPCLGDISCCCIVVVQGIRLLCGTPTSLCLRFAVPEPRFKSAQHTQLGPDYPQDSLENLASYLDV